MKTLINISNVTDYSGEPPVITYSNPVTTIINDILPVPVITRHFYCTDRYFINCCNFCNCCDCCQCPFDYF